MNLLKKITSMFVLAILASGISGCGDTKVNGGNSTGSDVVSGTLRDTATGQPIFGAVITSTWATTTTNKDGNWSLGGAPVVVNSGSTSMTASSFNVSIDTSKVTAPINMAGTPAPTVTYPAVAYRTLTVSAGGANNLEIGKLSATVKGLVTTSNGTPVSGATVTLGYVASLGTGTAGAALGQALAPVTTDATGAFTVTGVETGATLLVSATNGTFTKVFSPASAISGSDNFTTNLPAIAFDATPDTQGKLGILSPTITVGTTTSAANTGNFAANASTTITFPFTRAIKADQFTANTTEVLNSIFVNSASKAGNVPFTVAYTTNSDGTISAVKVTFATAASRLYTVSIANPNPTPGTTTTLAGGFLANVVDAFGNPAFAGPTVINSAVIFSTGGGTDLSAVKVGALRNRADLFAAATIPAAGAIAASTTAAATVAFDWAPVAGAVSYNVYRQETDTFVDNSTRVQDVVLQGNVTAAKFTPPDLVFVAGDSTRLSYKFSVRAVNSDGVEGAAQDATNGLTYADDNNANTTRALAPVATVPLGARATGALAFTTAQKAAAVGSIATFSGNYSTSPGANPPSDFVTVVTFSEPMIKSLVEDGTKWGFTDTGNVAPPTTNNIASVVTGTNGTQGVTVTPTVRTIVYDSANHTATITYNLAWSFSTPGNDLPGQTYTVSAPTFRFTFAGTDLNGNAVAVPTNQKGF